MPYELAIIQNYSSDEHNIVNRNSLPGFFSIKKTLWNIYSDSTDSVDEFVDVYNQIIAHRDMDYRIFDSTINVPYMAIIFTYQYDNIDFLRDKTYLIVILQRKIKNYIKKKKQLLKSPKALFYREIHGRYPSYKHFYSGNFRKYY